MPNPKKIKQVEDFSKDIKGKTLIYFDYEGMDVEVSEGIREKLRECGGTYRVLKNRLVKRSLDGLKFEYDESFFKGMMAVAIVDEEVFASGGKVLLDAEKKEHLAIKGGFYEGKKVDADYVKKLASIPSKEALYSILVGCLQGCVGNLVYTLEDISKQKKT